MRLSSLPRGEGRVLRHAYVDDRFYLFSPSPKELFPLKVSFLSLHPTKSRSLSSYHEVEDPMILAIQLGFLPFFFPIRSKSTLFSPLFSGSSEFFAIFARLSLPPRRKTT